MRYSQSLAGKRFLSCYCHATAQVLSFFYPWLKYNCTRVLKGWQGNKGKVDAQQVRCGVYSLERKWDCDTSYPARMLAHLRAYKIPTHAYKLLN